VYLNTNIVCIWRAQSSAPAVNFSPRPGAYVNFFPNPRSSVLIRGKLLLLLFRSSDHRITRDHPLSLLDLRKSAAKGSSSPRRVSVVGFAFALAGR